MLNMCCIWLQKEIILHRFNTFTGNIYKIEHQVEVFKRLWDIWLILHVDLLTHLCGIKYISWLLVYLPDRCYTTLMAFFVNARHPCLKCSLGYTNQHTGGCRPGNCNLRSWWGQRSMGEIFREKYSDILSWTI